MEARPLFIPSLVRVLSHQHLNRASPAPSQLTLLVAVIRARLPAARRRPRALRSFVNLKLVDRGLRPHDAGAAAWPLCLPPSSSPRGRPGCRDAAMENPSLIPRRRASRLCRRGLPTGGACLHFIRRAGSGDGPTRSHSYRVQSYRRRAGLLRALRIRCCVDEPSRRWRGPKPCQSWGQRFAGEVCGQELDPVVGIVSTTTGGRQVCQVVALPRDQPPFAQSDSIIVQSSIDRSRWHSSYSS